jgi:NAD(P) transhydrogenase subunit beta
MMFTIHEIVSIALLALILLGLRLMNSPGRAFAGNCLGALAMLAAIAATLIKNGVITMPLLWASMAPGVIAGAALALLVPMIAMPQTVALLNGLGGGASMLVGLVVILEGAGMLDVPTLAVSMLAIAVGGFTLSGSLAAAGKLQGLLTGGMARRGRIQALAVLLMALPVLGLVRGGSDATTALWALALAALALGLGALVTLPVGGADMPVAIALLNSLSGLAASICGFALGEMLLVGAGAIVGAAGLILTRIMCGAMNRSIKDIFTAKNIPPAKKVSGADAPGRDLAETMDNQEARLRAALSQAKTVVIIPGYGMALAQAQFKVRELYDALRSSDREALFAIHPVAGRMPGHMNVLLAEADIPYDTLIEMDDINPRFAATDLAIVVGACDVVNPAAGTAEGTPLYGMPVLEAHRARHIIVCNRDREPGYSGVPNSLYDLDNTIMLTGNAVESLERITGLL